MKRDHVSVIGKWVALSICVGMMVACSAGAKTSTSAVPSATTTPSVDYFTDGEAESFGKRLASIGAIHASTDLRTLILDSVGVDILRLRRITGIIGNCISIDYYELSPSYELVVDTNACYEGGVAVVKKGSERSSRLVTDSPN